MAEAALVAGVRRLFALLPPQSAFRRPLSRILLDDLSLDEVCQLDLGVNEETLRRYRNADYDTESLLSKRIRVDAVTNAAFAQREKLAACWIDGECGVTQSGRVATVFKTEMTFSRLFALYQDRVPRADQVSVNVFARLAKHAHVHFGVGAVDTMTCVLCRDLAAEQDHLEEQLQECNKIRARKRLQDQLDAVTQQLATHQEALERQRHAWKSDLNDVMQSKMLVLCVLDFSTFELMDRKTTSVFCVVVVDSANGVLRRRYIDFVDVHLKGRKRDMVFYAMTMLFRQQVFAPGQRVRLWSDAGSSDFRNASCLYSFLQLNSVCTGIAFESFNFFGARHGWNDCDRHFGNAKQALSRWLVEEASQNKTLTLDVRKCGEILAAMPNTTVLEITNASIAGAEQQSIKGLTKHYCFRFVDAQTAGVAMFSDETSVEFVSFPDGQMLSPSAAQASAKRRKTGKK